MVKRRYTVEATPRSLVRFFKTVDSAGTISDAFVLRVNNSVDDEYHYVHLLATEDVHRALRGAGYSVGGL